MLSISRVNRQPLYEQVRQILLKAIQSGQWGPGEKIPIEPVLAHQLGVSIGTLRRAVESLVNDGVLLRREGVGTFVRTYRDGGYWNVFQIYRNLDGQKRGDFSKLIVFEVTSNVGEKIYTALNATDKSRFIHMVRHWIRTQNGEEEIVSIDESFLLADKFEGLTKDFFLQRFRQGESFYEFFDREFNVVIINQKCSAHYERLDELPDCSLLPDRKYQIPTDCYYDHLVHMQPGDDHISPGSHSDKAYGYGQMKCHT